MKPLIIANWKCNPTTLKEAKALFNSVGKGIKNIKNVEVVICPPFLYLSNVKCQKRGLPNSSEANLGEYSNVKIGAQNCFWEEKGAFTGEISPRMLKDIGVKYVILGHSERRIYLGETDEMINKKIKLVLKTKLNPILCVGETEEERSQGRIQEVLKNQLISALSNISKSIIQKQSSGESLTSFGPAKFSIAYEPIWAIGTGKACETNEAQTMGLFIRKIIAQLYGGFISKKVQILYGGSINSKNALSYIKEARMQGLLVGGASLDYKEFIQIIKKIAGG